MVNKCCSFELFVNVSIHSTTGVYIIINNKKCFLNIKSA